jgi:hypothetical protein
MHFFSEVSVKLSSLFIALFWTVELFQTMMQFTIALDPWKAMNKLEEFVVNLIILFDNFKGYMGLNVESIKNEFGVREDE